jgi:hypothetical protein
MALHMLNIRAEKIGGFGEGGGGYLNNLCRDASREEGLSDVALLIEDVLGNQLNSTPVP